MRICRGAFSWLLGLMLVASPGQAQEKDQEVYDLPGVVVTATKTAIGVKQVPSSVQVITQAEIRERGAYTLKDALRSATGIMLVRSGSSREGISIRGFDSRFSTILIDGRRIAAEVDQNFELDRIALENVERIEIVRGPVSSLYGTEALGGVVNIITKKSEKPSFAVLLDSGTLSGGRGDKERYNVVYDSGRIGKFGVVLSGSHLENDAVFRPSGLTYEPFGVRKNYNGRVDYTVAPGETITLTGGYMEEDTRERVGKGRESRDFNDRSDFSLSYNRDWGEGSLFFRYYQSLMHKNNENRMLSNNKLNVFSESRRLIEGFEGRLTRARGDRHIVTIGGEYRPERFRGTRVQTGEDAFAVTREGVTVTGSAVNFNYLAAYVQDEWAMSPKLLLITALRYDDSNKFESNLSPKLGLTYNAADNLRYKLNIAQGFRSPTPNQLYIYTATQRGNPELRSEKSNSYELAVEREFGKTAAKAAYFTNKVRNLITTVPVGGGIVQYQNINRATIQGLELEVTHPLSDRLSWIAGYTYLDAVNDATQTRLTNRARHKFTSRLAYDGKAGLRGSLWTEAYRDYILETGPNKSYVLWNVSVEKDLSPASKLIFGVDNIFNKKDEDVPLMGTYIHGGVRFSL